MPAAQTADKDNLLFTEFTFRFRPNGGSDPVPSLVKGPPGTVILHGVGAGEHSITFPTNYTNTIDPQDMYWFFSHMKDAGADPPIVATLHAGGTYPTFPFTLATPAGVATDFGPTGFERIVCLVRFKFTTRLVF